MSFLSFLPIIGDLFKGAKDLISEAVVDKDKKLELENKIRVIELEATNKILEMEHDEKLAQVDVAKLEASSNDAYVRRARPTAMWVCCLGMGYSFLLHPLFCWGLKVLVIWYPEVSKIVPPPNLDMTTLMPILLGMLGLSGYRTMEKIKGVKSK